MIEAKVRQATTTFALIEDLTHLEDLCVNGKPILTVKGGSAQELVARVFKEFSVKLDKAGKPFQLSSEHRGIMHTSPYNQSEKITGVRMAEYLTDFFQFVELVHSAPPQTFDSPPLRGGNFQYLKLLTDLPPHVSALLAQGRFLDSEMLAPFKDRWVDWSIL